jgi:hypothetical protein
MGHPRTTKKVKKNTGRVVGVFPLVKVLLDCGSVYTPSDGMQAHFAENADFSLQKNTALCRRGV